MYLEKNNPNRLSEQIHEIFQKEGRKLSRKPWNPFKPDLTKWWLIPSAEQIHFKYGKYYFDWGDEKLDSIICGICFDKGLDNSLSSAYPSKKGAALIMKPDWIWNTFINELNSGTFINMINELSEAVPGNIEFHFEGGYIDDPALYDPYSPAVKHERYELELDKNGAIRTIKAKRLKGELKALNKVSDLKSLTKIINQFHSDTWLKLNFAMVLRFKSPRTGGKPSCEPETWDAEKIRTKFLNKLDTWVK